MKERCKGYRRERCGRYRENLLLKKRMLEM